jgi:hypothetical protein
LTDKTPITAPATLSGRARAPAKAHDSRARLATQLWAAGPRRPCPLLDGEPRRTPGLEVESSNISLTPQSTRLDLPPVPPRQRPGDARHQTTTRRPGAVTTHPPYQLSAASLSYRRMRRRALSYSVRRNRPSRSSPSTRCARGCKASVTSSRWTIRSEWAELRSQRAASPTRSPPATLTRLSRSNSSMNPRPPGAMSRTVP